MAEFPSPHAAPEPARRLSLTGWAVLLVLASFLAYWPALHGGVLIDDPHHITAPEGRSLAGLARLWWDVGSTSQYYPLLHSAFWIEAQLWGDAVAGYHAANILQHALSALLLVAVMRRLGLRGAWFAGFAFALHPVAVESVAWISEQKNTLSLLFYLAAAYVYFGFDRDRRVGGWWIAFGWFVCALLTKSITATLPFALLVIFWWRRGGVEWRRDVRPLVPWIVVAAAMGLFSAWYEQVHANARGASFDLSLLERGLIAGRAIDFYVRTLVWPSNLMFVNPRWTVDATVAWQYVFPAVGLAVAGGLVWLARHRRGPLAAFLVYTGTLFPTLGFLNINWFNYSFVADHFQYHAMPAFLAAVSAGLAVAAGRLFAARAKWLPVAAGALVVAALGVQTWRQSGNYRDAEMLYRHTLARNPDCWLAHHNLGVILLDRGEVEEAIARFALVLRLKPDHLNAHRNLGYAFSRTPERRPEAIAAFEGALRLDPDDPNVLTHYAHALAQTDGRSADAVVAYRRALQANSRLWETHAGLARLLVAYPATLDEGLAEYRKAVDRAPQETGLRYELAEALVMAGRTTQAAAEFAEVVRLRPDHATAHYNLGSLLAEMPGRVGEAVEHFETALRLTPDDPGVHNNLALALLSLGRRDDAIRHLQSVLRLEPNSAKAYFNLGRALLVAPADERAALAQFEAAVRLQPEWEAARQVVAQLRARRGE